MAANDRSDEIDKLVEESWNATDRAVQADLLDRAIALADAAGDVERAWALRTDIFEPATFGGKVELMLVHFAWCLAASDRDPEQFPIEDLFWTYKWAINNSCDFPAIPLKRIREMADDFERRLASCDYGPRTANYMRWKIAVDTKNHAEAEELYAGWHDLDRDYLADCEACEANSHVQALAFWKQDAEAFEQARPLLGGKLSCAEVPHLTYGILQLPAVRTRDWKRAGQLLAKGYRAAAAHEAMVRTMGEHIQMLALTHNVDLALQIIARHIGDCLSVKELNGPFAFSLGTELVMRRAAGRDELELRLPRTFPLFEKTGRYSPKTLADHFGKRADDIARAFDRRNGNTWYADHAAELRGLLDEIEPVAMTLKPASRKKKEE